MKDLKKLVVVSSIGGHCCWEIVDVELFRIEKKQRRNGLDEFVLSLISFQRIVSKKTHNKARLYGWVVLVGG